MALPWRSAVVARAVHRRSRPSIVGTCSPLLDFPRNEKKNPQCRFLSSSMIPEFAQHWTIWGGSGWMLKTIHMNGTVPYWGCFALTNVMVRTALIPMVLHSAHTAARFAKVAPEVQFLVTIFQRDLKKQQDEGASFGQQWTLMRLTMQTLGGIYKINKIHPLAVFVSPLLQIPIFYYVSIDLRKIINGADPELAQQLTESSFYWITDLTEPDPWFGLPVLGGVLLYWNLEMAIGKQSLSGPAAGKSNIAYYVKDFFQMVAVFMPCFMSQQPSGMQIYLCTSFLFTLGQGAALRNNTLRAMVGLPKLGQKEEAVLAKEFMELKELERKAQELRGDGPLLGRGVLAAGFETSFAGRTNVPTSIVGSNPNGGPLVVVVDNNVMPVELHTRISEEPASVMVPFIHGISAPPRHVQPQTSPLQVQEQQDEYMPDIPDDVMEAANRGELPVRMAPPTKKEEDRFNAKRFIQRKKKRRTPKSKKK